ncbi:MAG: hypothetical protein MUF58_20195 [Arcicella sp.]|jgi:hypothetical protein|nr:hypothetical protein [Arcicella sp.]
MEIGYAQIGGVSEEFNSVLNSLRDNTNLLFKGKFYGEDLHEIHVGVICVAPEYDHFFKVRKTKYKKEHTEYIKDGVKYSLSKNFEYDLKLNYSLYKTLKDKDLKERLVLEIFDSFQILKSKEITKKNIDFDRELFFSDLEKLKNI